MNVEKLSNIFQSIPDNLDSEIIETIVQSKTVKVERIISKGHSSPATSWYNQPQSEWVIVLQGEAIITVENDRDYTLVSGSFLNLPAHTRHKVKWTKPDIETVWLAVHY
jgi:cupin 2 domain-containing protein